MISVLLADDHALVRAGFRMILEAQEGIEIAGEADNGRDALAQARTRRPDIVLMDIRMPGLDGIAATREILAEGLPSRVLVLTTFDEDKIVYDAMKAGASGFLLKTGGRTRLRDRSRPPRRIKLSPGAEPQPYTRLHVLLVACRRSCHA
jgi:DNA-binding NarL/FixJ family response regulator